MSILIQTLPPKKMKQKVKKWPNKKGGHLETNQQQQKKNTL